MTAAALVVAGVLLEALLAGFAGYQIGLARNANAPWYRRGDTPPPITKAMVPGRGSARPPASPPPRGAGR